MKPITIILIVIEVFLVVADVAYVYLNTDYKMTNDFVENQKKINKNQRVGRQAILLFIPVVAIVAIIAFITTLT